MSFNCVYWKSPKIVFLYLISYYSNSWPVKPVKIHNDLKCCHWYDANIWCQFKPWTNDVIHYFIWSGWNSVVSVNETAISGDGKFLVNSITLSDKNISLMLTWLCCVFLFEKCDEGCQVDNSYLLFSVFLWYISLF